MTAFCQQAIAYIKADESALNLTQTTSQAAKEVFNSTCFTGETLVWCKDGMQIEIEFVEPGLEVLSRNEITGEMSYRRILRTFMHRKIKTWYV